MSILVFAILVLVFLLVGVWLIEKYAPGDPTLKRVICLLVGIVALAVIAHRAGWL